MATSAGRRTGIREAVKHTLQAIHDPHGGISLELSIHSSGNRPGSTYVHHHPEGMLWLKK